MSAPVAFLAAHGGALLAGSSAVLGAGALALAASRAPIHRQRLAELALAAALCCVVLAVLPLPRFSRAVKAEPATVAAPSAPMELVVEPPRAPAPAPLPQPIAPVPPRVALASPPSAAVAAPTQSTLALPWPEWLALTSLAGFAAAAAYLVLGVALLVRLLRRAQPAPAWL